MLTPSISSLWWAMAARADKPAPDHRDERGTRQYGQQFEAEQRGREREHRADEPIGEERRGHRRERGARHQSCEHQGRIEAHERGEGRRRHHGRSDGLQHERKEEFGHLPVYPERETTRAE
jgi:hypothetical protein